MGQKKEDWDGRTYKEGNIKYKLQLTSDGFPPDSNSNMSVNMTRLFIKIEDDDRWYQCLETDSNRVRSRIRKLGSPVAYILSLGYNEVYHYLVRKKEALDEEEDQREYKKLEQLVKEIEKIHGTCHNIES